MMVWRPAALWICASLAVIAMLVVAPWTALGGGDEEPAPPSVGPPGPWSEREVGEGEDLPYRPTDAKGCRLGGMRRAGPGSVLGLWVVHTRCATAKGVVGRYQRCLNSERGRKRRCYARIDRRCVRPVFLGRCSLRDRFFRRRVMGYSCTERRLYEVEGLYEARVMCRKDGQRISHTYTLHTESPISVDTESELRAAWANPRVTAIDVRADIFLRACERGDPMRESARPVLLEGHGHMLRQTCFEKRLLRQDGTGFVELRNVTLTRGGSDGPGAAVTTRGEILVVDSKVHRNLAEEPGGGIMSQRRATIVRSVITGNLANDDGGGVYARRGGVQVFDSIVNGNLVDGSGGAIGSTGDILVVRSHVDGNTTDGDGGALYADEDGDITVIDSTVDGSTADGPGGAIFTLDGDVTIVNSDGQRQPRRRPGRGDLGRGRRDRHQLHDRPQRSGRARRRRRLGPRRPVRGQLDDQQQLRRGRRRRCVRRGDGWTRSGRRSSTTSRRSPRTSAPASGWTRSARSSARPRRTRAAARSSRPRGTARSRLRARLATTS